MKKNAMWRHIFLEIALRAMRKTHYDFGVWNLGQEELTLKDFNNLNQGHGIDFAPEETVRDSILQEIIYTGLSKAHKIDGELKSYWIDREVKITLNKKYAIPLDKNNKFFNPEEYSQPNKYSDGKKDFRIDIVFKRIQEKNRESNDDTYPCLIEAKRHKLVNINLKNRKIDIGEPQIADIDKDILKLKLIYDYYSSGNEKLEINGEKYDKFYPYILLWGTGPLDLNSPSTFNLKREVIDRLGNKEHLIIEDTEDPEAPIVKYLPIEWEFDENDEKLIVKKLLWVTLIELKGH